MENNNRSNASGFMLILFVGVIDNLFIYSNDIATYIGIGSASVPCNTDQKVGTKWSSKIYFDPEADHKGSSYYINQSEILTALIQRIEPEDIIDVQLYQNPLAVFPVNIEPLFHAFVVLQTQRWWWSVEKDTVGISIQRSQVSDAVIHYYKHKKRPSWISKVSLVRQRNGNMNIHDMIHWFAETRQLQIPYNLFTSNCQMFAQRVHDYLVEPVKQYPTNWIYLFGFLLMCYLSRKKRLANTTIVYSWLCIFLYLISVYRTTIWRIFTELFIAFLLKDYLQWVRGFSNVSYDDVNERYRTWLRLIQALYIHKICALFAMLLNQYYRSSIFLVMFILYVIYKDEAVIHGTVIVVCLITWLRLV